MQCSRGKVMFAWLLQGKFDRDKKKVIAYFILLVVFSLCLQFFPVSRKIQLNWTLPMLLQRSGATRNF